MGAEHSGGDARLHHALLTHSSPLIAPTNFENNLGKIRQCLIFFNDKNRSQVLKGFLGISRIFYPDSPVSDRVKNVFSGPNGVGLVLKLSFLAFEGFKVFEVPGLSLDQDFKYLRDWIGISKELHPEAARPVTQLWRKPNNLKL